MFKNLSLQGWRQFRRVDIDFHPRLTILTGANGAGKTTLLNLVSRHFGWASTFISTPKAREKSPDLFYSADYWDIEDEETSLAVSEPAAPVGPLRNIGTICYQKERRQAYRYLQIMQAPRTM